MAITTGKVRASFVHIFQPRVPENGGEPKYSLTLLIPKTDTQTLNAIYADIERAKQEGAQKVFGGAAPAMCRTPLYDGDGYRPSGEPFGEECHGCMVMTASAKQQPEIVDITMQKVINPSEVYSGCYIRANINFFAYSSNGNKGIGCGLNAVQKVADGEPLTARVSAEEAFGGRNAYQTPAAAPGYQQPAAPGYQQQAAPAPGYPQQTAPVPGYPGQMPAPGYQQPAAPVPGYPAQAPPAAGQAFDPITGAPMLTGGIMGM